MKVLFSSNKNAHFITITEYIENALKKICDFRFFDNRSFIVPGRIRKIIKFVQTQELSRINKNLIKAIKAYKPDIFLEVGGHRVLSPTVRAIKARGIKTALWTIDPPRNFNPIVKVAPFYDFIFTGGSEAYEILQKYNITNLYFLPFACDPEFHKPVEVSKEERKVYQNDIVFIGSYYLNRFKILEGLSDFDLGVWGPYWNKISYNSKLRKCIRKTEGVSYKEWCKIYSAAKIALMIHYQDEGTLCYQASPKIYEIMACRTFLLSDNQRDVVRLFEPGKQLDVFTDIKELKKKLVHYLDNPQKRESIAELGYQEVIAKHTYHHRLKEMFNIIKENL
jgi:spore maturation protein CgeB